MTQRIAAFRGEYRFLSNFYPAPLPLRGVLYPTAEHAYQAQKTTDVSERERIAGLLTPGDAKRAGQRIELRPDWDQVKKRIMLAVVLAKFAEDEDLGKQLVGTEDALFIEGNHWHDNFWGSCTCPRCGNGGLDYGLNYLGRILMMARDIIRVD